MRSTVERLKGVLSYSEIQATKAIASELGERTEGIVTTSSVTEKMKITRSVAVSAMKLLEAAGVLESRSLGMKGTYIKVIDSNAFKEVSAMI